MSKIENLFDLEILAARAENAEIARTLTKRDARLERAETALTNADTVLDGVLLARGVEEVSDLPEAHKRAFARAHGVASVATKGRQFVRDEHGDVTVTGPALQDATISAFKSAAGVKGAVANLDRYLQIVHDEDDSAAEKRVRRYRAVEAEVERLATSSSLGDGVALVSEFIVRSFDEKLSKKLANLALKAREVEATAIADAALAVAAAETRSQNREQLAALADTRKKAGKLTRAERRKLRAQAHNAKKAEKLTK